MRASPRSFPLAHSPNEYNSQYWIGLELNPDLPHEWQGSNYLSHQRAPPRVCNSQSQVLNPAPLGCGHLNHHAKTPMPAHPTPIQTFSLDICIQKVLDFATLLNFGFLYYGYSLHIKVDPTASFPACGSIDSSLHWTRLRQDWHCVELWAKDSLKTCRTSPIPLLPISYNTSVQEYSGTYSWNTNTKHLPLVKSNTELHQIFPPLLNVAFWPK